MFTCPKCKKKTSRLVYGVDDRACPDCNDPGNRRYALTHDIAVTGNGVTLTHAEAMRIRTNKLRPDGQYRPDARWRSVGPDWGNKGG